MILQTLYFVQTSTLLLSIITKVLFNDLIGQLVNLNILMILQTLYFVQTSTLLHHGSNSLYVWSCQLKHVVYPVQDDLDDLSVLAVQEVEEWRDNPLCDQVSHLC